MEAEMRFYDGERDATVYQALFAATPTGAMKSSWEKVSNDVLTKFFEGRLQWIHDTWAEGRKIYPFLPTDILAGAIAICLGWGENGSAAVKQLMMPPTDNTEDDRQGASKSSGSGSMGSSFSFGGSGSGSMGSSSFSFGGKGGGGKKGKSTKN